MFKNEELEEALEEFYASCIRTGNYDHADNARFFINENSHMGIDEGYFEQIKAKFEALDEEHTTPKMIRFNFKIEENEKELLKRDAHRHEMNISEYLRFLIKQEREKNGD